jgi:4-amino-4-deoxy-L-arabinose transferase
VIPLAALFLVKSRLVLYVVPVYAPVAVAMGYWLARRAKPVTPWLAAVAVVLVVGVKGVAGFVVSDRDMKRLYVETVRAGGPTAELHLFDEDARYGFEFYAGRVDRVAAPGSERPGIPLAVEVAEIPRNPVPEVFVARENRAAPLVRALAAEGIPYRALHVEGSEIIVAENRTGSPRRAGAAMRK